MTAALVLERDLDGTGPDTAQSWSRRRGGDATTPARRCGAWTGAFAGGLLQLMADGDEAAVDRDRCLTLVEVVPAQAE